jgi:hypothetical protein
VSNTRSEDVDVRDRLSAVRDRDGQINQRPGGRHRRWRHPHRPGQLRAAERPETDLEIGSYLPRSRINYQGRTSRVVDFVGPSSFTPAGLPSTSTSAASA